MDSGCWQLLISLCNIHACELFIYPVILIPHITELQFRSISSFLQQRPPSFPPVTSPLKSLATIQPIYTTRFTMLSKRNPALAAKIAQLSLPLAPLVSLPSGQVHPSFPKTLLSFWLLTTDQLDELAHFYHQRTPSTVSIPRCHVIFENELARSFNMPTSWMSDSPLVPVVIL